jgi:hypothetical protein
MLLDPEKIVNIADITIAARDAEVSTPFQLESLTGWQMLEGGLGNECATKRTRWSDKEVQTFIKRLSKRMFSRLQNLEIKYSFDNSNEIALHFQLFLVSVKINEARLQNVIEGKILLRK